MMTGINIALSFFTFFSKAGSLKPRAHQYVYISPASEVAGEGAVPCILFLGLEL